MKKWKSDTGGKERSVVLDVLKAIAIIAVVFYHIGYLEYGYLGVDIFLVINGFLVTQSLMRQIENDSFSYLKFLVEKIIRLWPLILLAGAISLITGYFVMLPDDYENLAESVVASNLFSNNILACITTRNYWDVCNNYKPLMHMWYVGILVQSYFILPIIPCVVRKIHKRDSKNCVGIAFLLIASCSLVLNILPSVPNEYCFYFLPWRFFEIAVGAAVACLDGKKYIKILRGGWNGAFPLALLILCLLCPIKEVPNLVRQILICMGMVFLIRLDLSGKLCWANNSIINKFSVIGKCTFSIFVWHQVILAFIRYTIKPSLTIFDVVCFGALLAVITGVSYLLIEKQISRGSSKGVFLVCAVACVIITSGAYVIYNHAGVVRDVPELNVQKDGGQRHMFAEYCDRVYSYDKDFSDDGRTKVVVIGNSYGRDWANILLESDFAEDIEVSYIFPYSDEYIVEHDYRMESADYIFWVISDNGFQTVPTYLTEYYRQGKVYLVGNKLFGESNGIIYNKRGTSEYYESSVFLTQDYISQNDRLKEKYNGHYIDLIGVVQKPDGSVRVFTDNHKFISQDCRHLTQEGAKYYARILDLNWIVK